MWSFSYAENMEIKSRDLSGLFLAEKSYTQNGNTFYYFLESAISFFILRPQGTSFLCLETLRKFKRKGGKKEITVMGDWALVQSTVYFQT